PLTHIPALSSPAWPTPPSRRLRRLAVVVDAQAPALERHAVQRLDHALRRFRRHLDDRERVPDVDPPHILARDAGFTRDRTDQVARPHVVTLSSAHEQPHPWPWRRTRRRGRRGG